MSGFILFTQRKVILNLISVSRYTSHGPQGTLLTYRSVNQSINQSWWCVRYSVNQWIQSINQSIKQSINQSNNQSIKQSINQSIKQSINQSIMMVCPVLILLKTVGELSQKTASVMPAFENTTLTIPTQKLSYPCIRLLKKTRAYEPQQQWRYIVWDSPSPKMLSYGIWQSTLLLINRPNNNQFIITVTNV